MLDNQSPLPLYEQLKQVIREQIFSGELEPGTTLPSEHELGRHYGVSRITVKRALDELAQAGLLRRIQGKGTIVAPRTIEGEMRSVEGFSAVMRRQGLKPRAHVLAVEPKDVDYSIRRAFDFHSDAPRTFTSFRRLLGIGDLPLAVLTSIVPTDVGDKMIALGVFSGDLFEWRATLYELRADKRHKLTSELSLG